MVLSRKVSGVLLTLLYTSLFSQNANRVSFTAQEALVTPQVEGSVLTLEGDVSLLTDSYHIRSQTLILQTQGEVQQIQAVGSVTLTHSSQTLILMAQELFYTPQEEFLHLLGQAELIDTAEDFNLVAYAITLNLREKWIQAEGAVRFTKGEVYAQADVLRYDQQKSIMDLVGTAHLQRQGEWVQARRIWLNLENYQTFMQDQISGQVLWQPNPPATVER